MVVIFWNFTIVLVRDNYFLNIIYMFQKLYEKWKCITHVKLVAELFNPRNLNHETAEQFENVTIFFFYCTVFISKKCCLFQHDIKNLITYMDIILDNINLINVLKHHYICKITFIYMMHLLLRKLELSKRIYQLTADHSVVD